MDQSKTSPSPIVVITATDGPQHYWRELWHFKELFFLFAWRDLLVRYKQTLLGVSWAIIRPLLTVLVFTLVFGKIAKLPSGNTPYALFVFAGMLPWQFFSTALTDAGNSLVANANIVSKIYFPRLLMPLASIAVCFVDAVIAGVIFLGLMLWYGVIPDWKIIFLPLFIIWLGLITVALSVWIAALNVTYRDFRYVIPFAVQLGLYVSPVGFSSEVIPEKWLWIFYLNPMAGVIDGFRWSILSGNQVLHVIPILISVVLTFSLLLPGLHFFRKKEDSFADGI
jgi:lipopolysaccharide transport system permease protein